ncbi:MAG: hypothetical protein HYY13_07315 [Nitrospirae bacterium]|nr:hypothetical protein [Nitrospirota bacterium]
MKLGLKQMLPFEKNREILTALIRAHPEQLPQIVETLRTLRWEGPKREDLYRLISYAQELERTGTITTQMDRDIESMRRAFISERKKP